MAWDPKALPWDWDTTPLLQGSENTCLLNRPNGGGEIPPPHAASPFGLGLFSLISSSAEGVVAQNRSIACLGGSVQHRNSVLPLPTQHDTVSKCQKVHKHRNMVCLDEISSPSRHGEESFSEVVLPEQQTEQSKEGKGSQLPEKLHDSKAGSVSSGESIICLELGKRTYFEDPPTGAANKAEPKSIGPNHVKKSRVAASVGQIPRCQVEGCKIDLTSAKDYHKRHKVCEMHSKSAVVRVAGQEQRFCQQCSRFHVLLEFDECKRSCRRRLAGHNERRRKPQPDILTWNKGPPTFQGDRCFSHFMPDRRSLSPYQGLSGISCAWESPNELRFKFGNHTWPRIVHFESQPGYNCPIQNQNGLVPINQNRVISSSPGATALSGVDSVTASQSSTRVLDSGCALSLLPSQWWHPHASPSVYMNMPGRSSMILDEWTHETPYSGHSLQGQPQQMVDPIPDKLMSVSSHSQNICMPTVLSANAKNIIEAVPYTELFMHGSSSSRNVEDCGLRESQGSNFEDVRLIGDALHASSFSQNSHLHESFGSSQLGQLGGSYTMELEVMWPYESSILDSHQI